MEDKSRLRARVRNATTAVLPQGTKVEVHSRPPSSVPSFDITVRVGSAEHRFSGGWAGEGWPAEVQRLLMIAPDVDVVYAEKLSEGARGWLIERSVGWVDEAGNAVIARPSGLLVSREAKEVKAPAPIQDRWTHSMLTAAEAIFAGISPTVEAVEVATGISRGAAANALARLERRGHLERPGQKRGPGASRRLANLDAFIDDYADAAGRFRAKQKVILIHRLRADALEALVIALVPALAAEGTTWAVTGAAASTLLAPYLSNVTVLELYVDAELFAAREHLANLLGGRVVEKGHVIEVRALPTSMSASGPKVGSIHVALPARVYADLVAGGGRFAEAAQHLREVRGVGPDT
jgi:hypothetical protein